MGCGGGGFVVCVDGVGLGGLGVCVCVKGCGVRGPIACVLLRPNLIPRLHPSPPSHPPTRPSKRQDCGRKFLDAVMTTARVELFLPKVEVVAALDHVNELYVIVAGGEWLGGGDGGEGVGVVRAR